MESVPKTSKRRHKNRPAKVTLPNPVMGDAAFTGSKENGPNCHLATPAMDRADLGSVSHSVDIKDISHAMDTSTNCVASQDVANVVQHGRSDISSTTEAKLEIRSEPERDTKISCSHPAAEKSSKDIPSRMLDSDSRNVSTCIDSVKETSGDAGKPDASGKKPDDAASVKGAKSPQKKDAKGATTDGPAAEASNAPAQKSKAEISRERRAIQEAQRTAKAARGQKQPGSGATDGAKPQQPKQPQQQKQQSRVSEGDTTVPLVQGKKGPSQPQSSKKQEPVTGSGAVAKDAKLRCPDSMQLDDEKMVTRIAKKLEKQHVPTRSQAQKKVSLFKHLHQYEHSTSLTTTLSFNTGAIHPAILKLGLQYAHGVISGSSARCVALLHVLKQVINDYQTPANKDFARDLDAHLSPLISFLNQCRLQSVSMGNAIKHIKRHINNTPSNCPDKEAKQNLIDIIENFQHERIVLAAKAIAEDYAYNIIEDGDVILVYACSSIVRKSLAYAHSKGKKFSVIVIDGRPKLEGVSMVKYLHKLGIGCGYAFINAVSHLMSKVTKVFLGAHAILANGYVMSRIGSAEVCLIAKLFSVPVLVCCETYKFCDRVQPDSFVFNELGDPDDLAKCDDRPNELAEWRSTSGLYLLNLMYDVMPHELITMIVTDVGRIPPTSVPIVLRIKNPDGY